jgi:hypothetical protein
VRFEYETRDFVVEQLQVKHRSDLARYVPLGGQGVDNVESMFWTDTLARFRRGEVWDAITAIERRVRPKFAARYENNNAYHFVEPAQ